jgi:hypothetical protein
MVFDLLARPASPRRQLLSPNGNLRLPPGASQTVKTLFAGHWKSLDNKDDFAACGWLADGRPAKWRRPLVETNPPRNSRLETHPLAGTSFKP